VEQKDHTSDLVLPVDDGDQGQDSSPLVRKRSDSEKGRKTTTATASNPTSQSKSAERKAKSFSRSRKKHEEPQSMSPELLSGILSPRVNIDEQSSPSAHYDFSGECSATFHADLCNLCAENMPTIDDWIRSSFTKFFPVQFSQL
jgi:hypothetical protein